MQETSSAGQPGSTQVPPAAGGFLDTQNEMAVPSPKLPTDEDHNSGGSKDVRHEFENSASGKGGS